MSNKNPAVEIERHELFKTIMVGKQTLVGIIIRLTE